MQRQGHVFCVYTHAPHKWAHSNNLGVAPQQGSVLFFRQTFHLQNQYSLKQNTGLCQAFSVNNKELNSWSALVNSQLLQCFYKWTLQGQVAGVDLIASSGAGKQQSAHTVNNPNSRPALRDSDDQLHATELQGWSKCPLLSLVTFRPWPYNLVQWEHCGAPYGLWKNEACGHSPEPYCMDLATGSSMCS